jgi:hypothetical protein
MCFPVAVVGIFSVAFGCSCSYGVLRNIRLKVPKCEIFDHSDFHYFYTIKPFWVDDFVVKILTYYFNFWG